MYQTVKQLNGGMESAFNELLELFLEKFPVELLTQHDEREWDMSKTYTPNYACIWNDKANIGEKCHIFQKNSQFALVLFKEGLSLRYKHIYRLEDLSIFSEEIPNKKDTILLVILCMAMFILSIKKNTP